MTIQLSREQARHLLARYHFTPTDLPGVFQRLSTVQYDPLNPVGRNPDLVLQARVPGYRVDDWLAPTYEQRLVYDSWDKSACLVQIEDWPKRALIRTLHRPYHDAEILQETTEVTAILAALDQRGPLCSLDFEKKAVYNPASWAGSTQAKRILRSLWASGELAIHHRKAGRHYYDRAQRVIPPDYFEQPPLLDEAAYYRWIVARRYQATGLLRSGADPAIWSACGKASQRQQALHDIVDAGILIAVQIGEQRLPFYAYAAALQMLEMPPLTPRVIFLGPLDSFLWDRKGVQHIFSFDYIWEVYKPEPQRRWGYYVLPVFYGDRFIARCDSRLVQGTWTIARWWWEAITPDATLLDALRQSMEQFLHYLHAQNIQASESVDPRVRQVVADLARL